MTSPAGPPAPAPRRHGAARATAWLAVAMLLAGCAGGAATHRVADEPAPADTAAPTDAPTPTDAPATDGGSGLQPVRVDARPTLPVTVTDARGKRVEVTDASRIVPLSGGLAEIVYSLGLGDRVVARDVAATFPQAEDLPVVTEGHQVSTEGVLSTRPTVVLADESVGPPEALDAIARTGVAVVVVEEAWTLDDVADRMQQVATTLGVDAAGEALVARTEADIADARPEDLPAGRPPRVAFLYLRGTAAVYLLGGEGSGADAMIEAVGGVDAGAEAGLGSFTPITSEAMVAAAPDVLLVMDAGLESVGGVEGLVELPGIAQTPGGRERRVVSMDDALLLSFGPRTGEALAALGERLVAVLDDAPLAAPA